MRLSVIVPARNEAAVLAECLRSLVGQSEAGFELGVEWELIVVDDDSTDGTRAIAEAVVREGVVVIDAPKLDQSDRGGFTGKTNACWAGAQRAHGAWLLFTDADTVHERGDMSRALHEAKKYGVALLSYSPRQIVTGFWQRAVMPLVFSELVSVYPPKKVNDPASSVVAANGQFLMVEREAYFAVGGHRAVGQEILEDVALARKIKRKTHAIRFRYAPDALAARMYRSLPEMVEGWTQEPCTAISQRDSGGRDADAAVPAVLRPARGGDGDASAGAMAALGDPAGMAADLVGILWTGGAIEICGGRCGDLDLWGADVLLAAAAQPFLSSVE